MAALPLSRICPLLLCALLAALPPFTRAVPLAPEEEKFLLQLKASWVEGADCDQLEGVTCDSAGRIIGLSLPKHAEPESDSSTSAAELPSVARRELASTPPATVGLKAPSTNKHLPFPKNLTFSGYMTLPTVGGSGARLIRYGSKEAKALAPKGFKNCNLGLPAAAVIPGFEDTGMSSGVVKLALLNSNGQWIGHCSGSLIAPNLVLTAGHCVYDTDKNVWLVGGSYNLAAFSRLNTDSDSYYSGAYYSEVRLFTAFQTSPTWGKTLFNGSDIAVVKLKNSIGGQTYSWSSPSSANPRANFGYPAVTQDGYTIVYDVTTASLTRGCYGFSSAIMCEYVSAEGGMSGGPIFSPYNGANVAGALSGGNVNGCPTYYTSLTGSYSLTTLVTAIGCKYTVSGGVYKATC